jgi:hypothetical protein
MAPFQILTYTLFTIHPTIRSYSKLRNWLPRQVRHKQELVNGEKHLKISKKRIPNFLMTLRRRKVYVVKTRFTTGFLVRRRHR